MGSQLDPRQSRYGRVRRVERILLQSLKLSAMLDALPERMALARWEQLDYSYLLAHGNLKARAPTHQSPTPASL